MQGRRENDLVFGKGGAGFSYEMLVTTHKPTWCRTVYIALIFTSKTYSLSSYVNIITTPASR
jgi:hypothetical protein